MDKQDLNTYIKKVIGYSDSNKFFNDSSLCSCKKSNPEKMNSILYSIVEQIKNISILLLPIIPKSANKVLNIINVNEDDKNISSIEKLILIWNIIKNLEK